MQAIREMIDSGVHAAEIAQQFGIPLGSIIAQKANYTYDKNRKADSLNPLTEEVNTTTFGLEKDLQRALRGRIDQLGEGFEIIDGGKERTVTSGRIDITAKDPSGSTVVIELKAGEAGRDAVGQILSYMGDLGKDEPPH